MPRKKRRSRRAKISKSENDLQAAANPSKRTESCIRKLGKERPYSNRKPRPGRQTDPGMTKSTSYEIRHLLSSQQPRTFDFPIWQSQTPDTPSSPNGSTSKKRRNSQLIAGLKARLDKYLRQLITGGQKQLELLRDEKLTSSDDDELMDWQPEHEIRILYLCEKRRSQQHDATELTPLVHGSEPAAAAADPDVTWGGCSEGG